MSLARAERALRRDAAQNYRRILQAAREVFSESGAGATIEEIAARAGVGIGTVYRRFASKDALIDELLSVALARLESAAEQALARTDGDGLAVFLRAVGQSLADNAGYAGLLLERPADPAARRRIRAAISELTTRAVALGTVGPDVTAADIMALIWSLRGLAQAGELPAGAWQRYLAIHLAGLRQHGLAETRG